MAAIPSFKRPRSTHDWERLFAKQDQDWPARSRERGATTSTDKRADDDAAEMPSSSSPVAEQRLTSQVQNGECVPRATFPGWRRRGEPGPRVADLPLPSHICSPIVVRQMCLKRGQQRWSALVSARTSRIARYMLKHLGATHWRAFVAYANAHYKNQFVAAFEPSSGFIACAGPLDGRPCPRAFKVHVEDWRAYHLLESLHLDHKHDLDNVCAVWRASVPGDAARWDQGIDRRLLCQMLFGVRARDDLEACLHFRCGSSRRDRHTLQYCHTSNAHYAQLVSDLRPRVDRIDAECGQVSHSRARSACLVQSGCVSLLSRPATKSESTSDCLSD